MVNYEDKKSQCSTAGEGPHGSLMDERDGYFYHPKVSVKQITQNFWSQNDVLITPTVGALFTKRICESDPLGPNFQNGTYTNFANLLGLNGLAIPFGKSSENVPWGLTLYSQPNRVNSAVQLAKDIACFVKS